MFANYLPYGVSFQNETQGLRYAVSVHGNSAPDRTIAGLGLSLPLGDWQLDGALEIGTHGTASLRVASDTGAVAVFSSFVGWEF